MRARNNKKQSKNKQISRCYKSGQTRKRGENNIKIVKKTGKENKKTEQATQHAATIPQIPKARKKQTETAKNCVKRGPVVTKTSATTNSAKLELVEWVKQTGKTNKQHRQKELTRIYVHASKPSRTSKQNKQTTVINKQNNMLHFATAKTSRNYNNTHFALTHLKKQTTNTRKNLNY